MGERQRIQKPLVVIKPIQKSGTLGRKNPEHKQPEASSARCQLFHTTVDSF